MPAEGLWKSCILHVHFDQHNSKLKKLDYLIVLAKR
jgi:hypothetical protein